jgi:NADH-quinone oxidoreductase subunit F
MAKSSPAPKMDDFKLGSVSDFAAYRDRLVAARDPNQPVIVVCHGTGCQANGSPKVSEALRKSLEAAGLEARVVPLIKPPAATASVPVALW